MRIRLLLGRAIRFVLKIALVCLLGLSVVSSEIAWCQTNGPVPTQSTSRTLKDWKRHWNAAGSGSTNWDLSMTNLRAQIGNGSTANRPRPILLDSGPHYRA